MFWSERNGIFFNIHKSFKYKKKMDKTLFQNISEGVERQQMLLDNADGVEEISFTRMLTP